MEFVERFVDEPAEDEHEDEDWDFLAEVIEDEGVDEGTRRYLVAIRDAKRKMQRRAWDKSNLQTVSTRLPVDEARRFRRLCRNLGTTRYKVLAGYIRALLDHHGY